MALKIADRIMERTNAAGTGSITLQGAFPGYRTFSAAFVDGDQVPYAIVQSDNFEVGTGTLTAGASWTLSRDVVTTSSNADAKIDVTESMLIFVDATMSYFDQIGIGDSFLLHTDFPSPGLMKTDGVGGYSIATDNSTNWDLAHGWGDHSGAGYLTSETSHTDVLVDGDFASEGVMWRDTLSGAYLIKTIGTVAGTIAAGDHTHDGLGGGAGTDTTALHDDDFITSGIMKATDGLGTYEVITDNSASWDTAATHAGADHAPTDADNTANNQTSHADVLIDGDFASEGVMYRDAASGSYSVKTIGTGTGQLSEGDHTHAPAAMPEHQHIEADITDNAKDFFLDNTYWTPSVSDYTWDAGENRWSARENIGGPFWTLTELGAWNMGFRPTHVSIVCQNTTGEYLWCNIQASGVNVKGDTKCDGTIDALDFSVAGDMTTLTVKDNDGVLNPGEYFYITNITFYTDGVVGQDGGLKKILTIGTEAGEIAAGDHLHEYDTITDYTEDVPNRLEDTHWTSGTLTWDSANRYWSYMGAGPLYLAKQGVWADGYRPGYIKVEGYSTLGIVDPIIQLRDTQTGYIASGPIDTWIPITFDSGAAVDDIGDIKITLTGQDVGDSFYITNIVFGEQAPMGQPVTDPDFSSEGIMYRGTNPGEYSVKVIGIAAGEIAAGDHTHAGLGGEDESTMSVVRSSKDAEGIFTVITWKRTDTTTYKVSTLTGTSPLYATRTVVYYAADGTTPTETIVYTIAYNDDYDLISETRNP